MCEKQGLKGMDQYFAMARGVEGVQALDMSKFFDTNYHYMVSDCISSPCYEQTVNQNRNRYNILQLIKSTVGHNVLHPVDHSTKSQQVPELDSSSTPKPNFAPFLEKVKRGQAAIGKAKAVPIVIGKNVFEKIHRDCITCRVCTQNLAPMQ